MRKKKGWVACSQETGRAALPIFRTRLIFFFFYPHREAQGVRIPFGEKRTAGGEVNKLGSHSDMESSNQTDPDLAPEF